MISVSRLLQLLHPLVPLLAVAAATSLRLAFDPWLGDEIPYGLFFLAIAVTVQVSGFVPAVIATVLSGLSSWWFFVEPRYSFDRNANALAGFFLFVVIGLVIARLGYLMQRGRANAETAEQDWKDTFDAAPDLIMILDTDSRIVRANKAMVEASHSIVEKLTGRKCFECVHDAKIAPEFCPHAKCMSDGKEHSAEVHELGGDFFVTCTPLFDTDGRLRGTVHVARNITEQKKAERALRESESRLKRAQEIAHLGSWELDVSNNRLTWSDETYRIFGLKPQEFQATYEAFLERVHPEDREKVDDAYSRSVREGLDSYEIEHRVIQKGSGEIRVVHEKCEHIRNEAGIIIRSIGMVHDITDSKKAQDAIALREERFRRLIEVSSEMVWVTNARGEVEEDSPSWRSFTGRGLQDWLGWNWFKVVHPEDREELARAWKQAVETKGLYTPEFRMLHHSGEYRYVQSRAVPVVNQDGSVREWIGMNTDVTESKQAERKLKENEARLSITFDRTGIGIVEVEGNDRFVNVNDRALEILGYTKEEFLKLTVHDITHSEDRVMSDRINAEMHEGKRNRVAYEKRYLKKDGTAVWLQVIVSAIRDEHGRWVRSIATLEDIGERKRAEEALKKALADLKEADRRKDEFLALLAHELRNPMSTISAASALLGRMELPPQARNIKDAMTRQVKQLSKLINDLLDISRVIQGKVSLEKENIDLKNVLEAAIEATKTNIQESKQALKLNLPAEPMLVCGDFHRLQEVFTNLLSNAARYGEADGKILIDGCQNNDFTVIKITDRGVGISQENQSKIFEPFTQLNAGLAREKGGLGIGLTIVKRLTELHGGTVSVHSEGVGKGTTFTVSLPTGKAEKIVSENKPLKVESGLRILIIDDNKDTAVLTATLLEDEAHSTDVAYDGESGLKLALEKRFDVILLDIGLPGIDGYEVARRIRAAGLDSTLLVAVTGYGQDQDREMSNAAGFDAHLLKPLHYDVLSTIIAQWQQDGKAKNSEVSGREQQGWE